MNKKFGLIIFIFLLIISFTFLILVICNNGFINNNNNNDDVNLIIQNFQKTKLNPKILNKDIPIVSLQNFLSHQDCDNLINLAQNHFQESPVVSSQGNIVNKDRTSYTAFLKKGSDPFLINIERKVSNLLNIPVENIEDLQVVRYFPGQFYKFHHDYFKKEGKHELKRGGQRLYTIFVYLSDVKENGYTNFPKVGVKVSPKKGNAAFWVNCNKNGKCNPNTLHAGDPPTREVKYGLNIWIRQNKFK